MKYLVLLCLGLTGCNGIPSPFDNAEKTDQAVNYGPETPVESVQSALSQAATGADPTQIKVGEYVDFTENQVVQNQVSSLVSETAQTVVIRNQGSDSIVYTIDQDKVTYNTDGTAQKVSTEFQQSASFHSTPAPSAGSATLQNSVAAHPTLLQSIAKIKSNNLKYYNLKMSMTMGDPPPAVKAASDCGGLSTCQIHLYKISFDQVDYSEDSLGNKIHIDYTISPDVPYLSAILNECLTALVTVPNGHQGSSEVLVQQCTPVQNFHFGHN